MRRALEFAYNHYANLSPAPRSSNVSFSILLSREIAFLSFSHRLSSSSMETCFRLQIYYILTFSSPLAFAFRGLNNSCFVLWCSVVHKIGNWIRSNSGFEAQRKKKENFFRHFCRRKKKKYRLSGGRKNFSRWTFNWFAVLWQLKEIINLGF